MSKLNSITTTNGLDWNKMLGLISRLKKDKRNFEYLLIASGSYFGLRAKDLLNLKWKDILNTDNLNITESKTGKARIITINPNLKEVFDYCKQQLIKSGNFDENNYLFPNKSGKKISIQYINRVLHLIFEKYNFSVQNGSTHTLRKTFGKRVWEVDGKSERSLIYLSQIFNHSSIQITKRYIGITQQDITNIYLSI
ncbi:MAG: tyrosine-type recombinase/integrase [Bacteroidales bacterium]